MAGSVFCHCRRMSPAGGAVVVALVAAVLVAIRGAGAAEPAAEAILDLPDGSALPGTLLEAPATDGPRGTIRWQSPLFTEPFEFHLDEIVGVRFSRPWNQADAAPFRFHLRGGDMLEGELEGIDAEHVIMIPRGAEDRGRVRIRRWAVEAISRVGGAVAGTYVGPGGLAGWRIAPQSAWRAEAGRIAANRPGTATLDVGGTGRARYDVVLSWRSKPDVRISVAAGTIPAEDAYRVELIHLPDGAPEAAVVREEAEQAALEPLAWGDASAKSLRLVIFVDQEKGRLAVAAGQDDAGAVTDIAVPPWPGRSVSGLFRIALGSGDVVLESLRVAPWTTPDPTLDDRSRAAVVTKTGGRTEAGVASFDKAEGELVLAAASGPVRLPIDDVDQITLADTADDVAPADRDAAAAAPLRAVLATGCTVAGGLLSIDGGSLRLRIEGIDDPVAVPLADTASLTPLVAAESPRALPGRAGSLLAEGVSLRGCVADGGPWSAGLAWQPQGSVSASPLAWTAAAPPDVTIEYVPRTDRVPVGDAQVEVGGIGGMVNQDAQGFFVVTMLAEEGAAARDGRVQPGDRLLAIKPRAEAGFVPTKGLDVTTVMNLLRGRVGSPVELRVVSVGGAPRDVDLQRGLIYVAGREILDQALATHAKFGGDLAREGGDAARYPALVILRSGDIVPCAIDGIDDKGLRLRTPVVDGADAGAVTVPADLIQAVELDPSVPGRTIEKSRLDRLLTLPRSQRFAPPTHMIRLRNGDYLRGRLESLDADHVTLDVRGDIKKIPRQDVVRVIWTHPGETDAHAEPGADAAASGLLVQGVAAGRRVTLMAEGLDGEVIRGTSPALGPGRIDLTTIDRLLVGRAIDDEADELPYRQWRLRPAVEPRILREAGPPAAADTPAP